MQKREDLEIIEVQKLAPFAVKSLHSKGRKFQESEAPFRTCFQRDRDRIIHSKAFRRMNGKTQVFIAGYGDHYRTRLTHSLEVAQFGRDIAQMLNLNQDLAEATGLAHDLGHTPFGHAGQDAMNKMMEQYGSRFEHNEQSFRVVDELELKSESYPGLNLSFEILDGLLKHRTHYDRPEAFDHYMPSLEAQVVNMTDEIAYQSHDIDDGLRSGIINIEGLLTLSICQEAMNQVKTNHPDLRKAHFISALMTLFVRDLAENTEKNILLVGIKTLEDIYNHPNQLACFSEEMSQKASELKDYLYQNFYHAPEVMRYNQEGETVITKLFTEIYKQPERLPEHFQVNLKAQSRHTVVKDYIAGMTDKFALELYKSLK